MKKLIQDFFGNYENQMEPSIDTEVFRNCIREKTLNKGIKITFPKLYRLAKAVTSFILFLMIGVLMHQKD